MQRELKSPGFPYEDALAAVVALIAVIVCAVAVLGPPSARGISYSSFVREQPAQGLPVPAQLERDDALRVAGETVTSGDAETSRHGFDAGATQRSCSPDTRAELQRLLDICRS